MRKDLFAHPATVGRSQVILAPRCAENLSGFLNVEHDSGRFDSLLTGMQRLRGRIYLSDGAISSRHLTSDGRHSQPADEKSWHLLTLDEYGSVAACARLMVHPRLACWSDLGVSRSALATDPYWGERLRRAVERELARARALAVPFVEAGGWAVTEALRHTPEAMRTALGAFCWAKLMGGAIGVTTATVRNRSAFILRKLGGQDLRVNSESLPFYFDPQYGCDMAILKFASDACAPKYQDLLSALAEQLASVPVIARAVPRWRTAAAAAAAAATVRQAVWAPAPTAPPLAARAAAGAWSH